MTEKISLSTQLSHSAPPVKIHFPTCTTHHHPLNHRQRCQFYQISLHQASKYHSLPHYKTLRCQNHHQTQHQLSNLIKMRGNMRSAELKSFQFMKMRKAASPLLRSPTSSRQTISFHPLPLPPAPILLPPSPTALHPSLQTPQITTAKLSTPPVPQHTPLVNPLLPPTNSVMGIISRKTRKMQGWMQNTSTITVPELNPSVSSVAVVKMSLPWRSRLKPQGHWTVVGKVGGGGGGEGAAQLILLPSHPKPLPPFPFQSLPVRGTAQPLFHHPHPDFCSLSYHHATWFKSLPGLS